MIILAVLSGDTARLTPSQKACRLFQSGGSSAGCRVWRDLAPARRRQWQVAVEIEGVVKAPFPPVPTISSPFHGNADAVSYLARMTCVQTAYFTGRQTKHFSTKQRALICRLGLSGQLIALGRLAAGSALGRSLPAERTPECLHSKLIASSNIRGNFASARARSPTRCFPGGIASRGMVRSPLAEKPNYRPLQSSHDEQPPV